MRLRQRAWTLDDLEAVASSDLRGAAGLAAKLAAHRDQLAMARRLSRVEPGAPTGVDWRRLRPRPPPLAAATELLTGHGLGRLAAALQRSGLCPS